MFYEGLSYKLRIVEPIEIQFMQFFQTFCAGLPTTQDGFYHLQGAIRRMAHTQEDHRGNIASQIGWREGQPLVAHRVHSVKEQETYVGFGGKASEEANELASPWCSTDGGYHSPAWPARRLSEVHQTPQFYLSRSSITGGNASEGGEEESLAATSTDTFSDDYEHALPEDTALAEMTSQQAGQHVYGAHRPAKKMWTRFCGYKPTRKARCSTKRKDGVKGQGKRSSFFLESAEGLDTYWASKAGPRMKHIRQMDWRLQRS